MEFEPHQTVACGDSGNDIGEGLVAAEQKLRLQAAGCETRPCSMLDAPCSTAAACHLCHPGAAPPLPPTRPPRLTPAHPSLLTTPDMLEGEHLSIIVGNAHKELLDWAATQRAAHAGEVYIAQGHRAFGILEGLQRFGFKAA